MASHNNTIKNKILPTPPLPDGLPQVDLSENSYQVLTRAISEKVTTVN